VYLYTRANVCCNLYKSIKVCPDPFRLRRPTAHRTATTPLRSAGTDAWLWLTYPNGRDADTIFGTKNVFSNDILTFGMLNNIVFITNEYDDWNENVRLKTGLVISSENGVSRRFCSRLFISYDTVSVIIYSNF